MSQKKRQNEKKESTAEIASHYYPFTLPQSILNARREWSSGSQNISNYEKALAMIVFGQLMKTGASINGWWWGTNPDQNVGVNSSSNQVIFFQTHPEVESRYFSPVVKPTESLKKLEAMFNKIS
jgi:hypothetical protein